MVSVALEDILLDIKQSGLLQLNCVIPKEGLDLLPSREVLDALHLPSVVAGLLEVDLQLILQVLLVLHVLHALQQDGPLRSAAERLRTGNGMRLEHAGLRLEHAGLRLEHAGMRLEHAGLILEGIDDV